MNLDDLKFYAKVTIICVVAIALIVGVAVVGANAISTHSQQINAEFQQQCNAAQGQYVLNSNGTASCYYPKPTPIGAGR